VTEKLDGLIVATALPYAADPAAPAGLRPDLDRYAEHCRWLVDNGCRGVGPNGSLGEYSSLTDAERRAVARTAIDAVGNDGVVVVGVHGAGAHQARYWAELAAEDGADGVLCLPPTMFRANRAEVVHHFAEVAKAGLPVMVYKQSARHPGRSDPGPAGGALAAGEHRRREGVLRRRPADPGDPRGGA
jgi:4-hydroxy-tetrahydrodipicolinate synthase